METNMDVLIAFFIGILGGFFLGKKHGAKVQSEADKLQARLNDAVDRLNQ